MKQLDNWFDMLRLLLMITALHVAYTETLQVFADRQHKLFSSLHNKMSIKCLQLQNMNDVNKSHMDSCRFCELMSWAKLPQIYIAI